jgi:murein L,D-transpeptidase YafK
LYGWGALPISYPNEWDRLTGKTGYGIWLHGVPADSYARAPWASDGCIALANPDIEALASRVEPGTTPVVIAERTEWLAPQEWHAQREAFLRQLDAWRADWESRDTERYLTHYSRGFRSASMNLTAWSAHKRRVNKAKAWIKVRVANLSVLRSPGARDLMVVTFQQDYSSTNFVQQSQQRQYWVMEDNRWKIAYEAPVGRAPVALPESYPRQRRSRTR